MQPTGMTPHPVAIQPAIDYHPLTVAPDTPLVDVLALMSRAKSSCVLSNSATDAGVEITNQENEVGDTDATVSCVLVMAGEQLLGVFTNRDIVRLSAAGTTLTGVAIGDVVSPQVITCKREQAQDVFTVLSLFRQHRIRHLPIVDDSSRVLGIITNESIRKSLQPVNLLTRLRYVKDVMTTQVVNAPLTASILDLARLMAQAQVSCVVITQDVQSTDLEEILPLTQNSKLSKAVGIVTEGDIVQFQSLELDLSRTQAQEVMSTPLFRLLPTDTLWVAHEKMHRRHVGRLVVVGSYGELLGIVSQTSLLQVLNPADMYGLIEVLQQAVDERTKELKSSNDLLRQEIAERERAEKALKLAHDNLKRKVDERTAELAKANALLKKDILDRVATEAALRQSEAQLKEQATKLEEALQELQATQFQLIQTEKMSSLGQLVAGVAHEINNPINFISGNINYASEYINKMLHVLELYAKHYPQPALEIQEEAEEIDLEFLKIDLPKLLGSMKEGADRIRNLVLSLRNFSRLDEAEMKYVNIHDGLESSLSLLQSQLKAKAGRPEIAVIKEYGTLPTVECYPGQLNQVFMNILSNAIDALDVGVKELNLDNGEISTLNPTIWIRTTVVEDNQVEIRVVDNGSGMSKEVQRRLFDPFFTTKPVGEGKGLGLSISYQIVIEKHGGQLQCISAPGEGAEFVIQIPMQQKNSRLALTGSHDSS